MPSRALLGPHLNMARVLRGDVLAANLCLAVAREVRRLGDENELVPGLAVVIAGDDPASQIYVARKIRKAAEVGIRPLEHRLAADVDEAALLALIGLLNDDPNVHGILVQLPLPPHVGSDRVLDAIDPAKDVDGFHPVNVGRLSIGAAGLTPCTPLGCMLLLEQVIDDFKGRKAVAVSSDGPAKLQSGIKSVLLLDIAGGSRLSFGLIGGILASRWP